MQYDGEVVLIAPSPCTQEGVVMAPESGRTALDHPVMLQSTLKQMRESFPQSSQILRKLQRKQNSQHMAKLQPEEHKDF